MSNELDINSSIQRYKRDLADSLDVYLIRNLCNDFALSLNNTKAKGYIYQGVLRRLMLLRRCIENINNICPIDAEENIESDENADLVINLHAFYINIQGLLDNIAWVFVHEKGAELNRMQVNLFSDKVKGCLPEELNNYLLKMKTWFFDYSKLYRDCLAHRIPLYAPKLLIKNEKKYKELELEKENLMDNFDELVRIMDEQEQLLEPPKIISVSDIEDLGRVKLHAQTLTDFITVKAIVKKAFMN